MAKKINKVIEDLLNDKDIKNLIKNVSRHSDQVNISSVLVGEVYTYCLACNDGGEIKKEEVIDYLNARVDGGRKNQNEKHTISRRARTLAIAMGKRLGFDEKNVSPEQMEQVKNYFLKNYVNEGYVMHSFPAACKNSIDKHGFSSNVRIWDSQEILDVASIFESHGVIMPVGGYSHYKGGGMYVEHDPQKVFWHSLSSPEWFRYFTSCNHTQLNNRVAESPFLLRDYKASKKNVVDLCVNAGLSKEEQKRVLSMFETNWKILKDPKLPVAMIPKKEIGKDTVHPEYQGLGLVDTIDCVLSDSAKEYTEHKGNCLSQTITREQMLITTMPGADNFLTPEPYERETKQDLFDPERNFKLMKGGVVSGFSISYPTYQAVVDKIRETFSDNETKLGILESEIQEASQINGFPSIQKVDRETIIEEKNNNPTDFPEDQAVVIEKFNKEGAVCSNEFEQ